MGGGGAEARGLGEISDHRRREITTSRDDRTRSTVT